MLRIILLALSFGFGCAPSPPPPEPTFDDDHEVRTTVPLPAFDENQQRGGTAPAATTATLVAPPLLPSSTTPIDRLTRIHIGVDESGVLASLRRAKVSEQMIATLDDATVRRVDIQSQIEPGSSIDLFVRGDVLVGLRADTIIGMIWAARYDGTVSPRGWYDDSGRSLAGPIRARPVDLARVTSGYGTRLHPLKGTESRHTGIDYGAAIGTPVVAVGPGTVREAASSPTSGNYVKLTHPDGWESWYLHLNDAIVKKGDKVAEGQIIAHTGNTGASTGPHLHFELRIANISLDPRRTVPVPTLALSPRELPRHTATLKHLKEIQ